MSIKLLTLGYSMESRNIALQGTLCLSGTAKGVCVGLGDSTVFSRIAKSASGDRPMKTSLEQEITRFVWISESMISAKKVKLIR
jgi:sodium/potassium-transporting ATPase subunit alpha